MIDLTVGSLSVWVPEEIGVIPPEKLLMDIAYPPDLWTGISHKIAQDLATILKDRGPWLLLGETNRLSTEPPTEKERVQFVWPIVASTTPVYVGYSSLDLAHPAIHKFLCVCVAKEPIGQQKWIAFEKQLKEYPSIAIISGAPPRSCLAAR